MTSTEGRKGGSTAFVIEAVAKSRPDAPAHSPHGFDLGVRIDDAGACALTRVSRRPRTGGTADETLLWDLSTCTPVPGAWIALHPGGARALRRDLDGRAVFCDLATGVTLSTLEIPSPRRVAMSPDSPHAVHTVEDTAPRETGARTANVVWDLGTGARIHDLSGAFLLEAFVPGGRLLAVDDRNGVTLWDLATGKAQPVGRGPGERPSVLRVDREGRRAVVLGVAGTTWVWDLAARRIVHTHDAFARLHGGPPEHVHLLADGRRLVAEGWFLDVLDLETGALDRSWVARDPDEDGLLGVAPLSGGPYVATLVLRGLVGPATFEVWDVDRKLRVGFVKVPDAEAMAVAPSGRAVIADEEKVLSFQLRAQEDAPLPPQPRVPRAILAAHAAETAPAARKKPAPKKPATKKPARKKA